MSLVQKKTYMKQYNEKGKSNENENKKKAKTENKNKNKSKWNKLTKVPNSMGI